MSDYYEPSGPGSRWVGNSGQSQGYPAAGVEQTSQYPGGYGAYGTDPAGWHQQPGYWTPAGQWPPPAPPRRRGHPMLVVVVSLVVVLLAMVAGGAFVRVVWPVLAGDGSATASGTGGVPRGGYGGVPGQGTAPQQGTTGDAAAVANAIAPTIVDVNTTLGLQGAQAAGTGIVLTSSGEVLTNNHVIAGATSISVVDVGNGRTYNASVVGYDRSEDIAVIQLQNASGLKTAPLGDASKVGAGDSIVALGNAGGVGGTPSAVSGTVTATNQPITASDENGANAERLTGLIQIAANIQPGDSGGPLVGSSGKVIGVDTAASTGFRFQASGGQGYAIPINQAVSIAKDIKAGKASATIHIGATAFLGVSIQTDAAFAGGLGGTGAPVGGVVAGSPAAQAGVQRGDTITSVDGQAVTQPETVTTLLEQHHPGDKVKIGWVDSTGQAQTATVKLATGPAG